MSGVVNTGAHAASGSGGQPPGGDGRRPNEKPPLDAAAKEAERNRKRSKKQRKRQRDAEARRQAASGQRQGQQSAAQATQLSALIQAARQARSDDPLADPVYWLGRSHSQALQLERAQRNASQGGSQGSNVRQEARADQEANTVSDVEDAPKHHLPRRPPPH